MQARQKLIFDLKQCYPIGYFSFGLIICVKNACVEKYGFIKVNGRAFKVQERQDFIR